MFCCSRKPAWTPAFKSSALPVPHLAFIQKSTAPPKKAFASCRTTEVISYGYQKRNVQLYPCVEHESRFAIRNFFLVTPRMKPTPVCTNRKERKERAACCTEKMVLWTKPITEKEGERENTEQFWSRRNMAEASIFASIRQARMVDCLLG